MIRTVWSKEYKVTGLTMDETAADVSSRLGVELQPRHSSYGGPYYFWRDGLDELAVRNNVVDGGELTGGDLTYPGRPEGVLIFVDSQRAETFSDLETNPAYELYSMQEFGAR